MAWEPDFYAQEMVATGEVVADTKGAPYIYQESTGAFTTDGARERLYAAIRDQMAEKGDTIRHARIEEVIRLIVSNADNIKIRPGGQPWKIAFRNITLNLTDPLNPQEEEHSPENYITWHLPHDYQPDADCPRWQRFLDETWAGLPGDVQVGYQLLLAQFFGAMLLPKVPPKGALFLWSEHSDSGKTTIAATGEGVFGTANLASISPKDLGEDKNAPLDLYGKMGNIVSECPVEKLRDSAVFKKITGGHDYIKVRILYTQTFMGFYNIAPSIFAANRLPKSWQDETGGFHRRVLAVPCPNRATNPNPNLLTELIAEAPGIINWALSALADLWRAGWNWTLPQQILDHQQAAWEEGNQSLVWADLATEPAEGHRLFAKEAGDRFRDWLVAEGHLEKGDAFHQGARKRHYKALDTHFGDRKRHSKGPFWPNRRLL